MTEGGGGMGGMMSYAGMGFAASGQAMQYMAQRKREKAQDTAAAWIRYETMRYGQEQHNVSDTLRKALEAVARARGETTQEYFDRRVSPERQIEGQRLEQVHTESAQGGLERALGALKGPAGRYEPPGSTVTAADAVAGAPVEGRSLYDQSTAVYGGQQNEILQALMGEMAARGYLSGVAGFDTQNQQRLAMGLRPLDNEAFLRQLLTGVRQGEAQFVHGNNMNLLGQQMDWANRVGSNEMLWGSILQNLGQGMGGSTSGSTSFTESGAAGANPNANEGMAGMNTGGSIVTGGDGTGGDVERPNTYDEPVYSADDPGGYL